MKEMAWGWEKKRLPSTRKKERTALLKGGKKPKGGGYKEQISGLWEKWGGVPS